MKLFILLVIASTFSSCNPSKQVRVPKKEDLSKSSFKTTSSNTSTALYRAININGAARTSNGINFEASSSASNFVVQGSPLNKQYISLSPSADTSLSEIIRSFVWGNGGQVSLKMSQIPPATYEVYLYVWEDNNSETFSILLNGSIVESNYISGTGGSWKKLGPWRKSISDGNILINTTGGAANLSALEIYKISEATSSDSNNLVKNSGFDMSLNSWINLGNTIRVSSDVHTGSGSARVGTGAGGLLQNMSLKPSTVYNLSGYAKVGSVGETGNFGVTFKDSTGKEIVNYQFKVTETTYTKKALSFTSPASFSKAEVWIYKSAGSSHLYLDEIFVSEKITSEVATCTEMGSITHEKWDGISGTSIASIPLSKAPTFVKNISSFEMKNLGDNYGTRISGFICPPVSGNYTFIVSGDDDTKLSLSSNDSAANLNQIAGFSGWTNYGELTKYSGQKSQPVALTAGKKYFIEVLHKEGGGGDHVSVGWIMPDGKQEFPLPSSRIAPKTIATGPTPAPAPTPTPAPVVCKSEGKISLEKINNIHSTDPMILEGKPADSVSTRDIFEAPTNIGDSYGHRMSGYICVPSTGNYTFFVSGDDQVALFLSSDESDTNKVKIAYHNGWTNPREYTKYSSQTSAPVKLEGGKKYYIEALQVEGGGGDNLSVGWKLPDGTFERPIPGHRLSTNQSLEAHVVVEKPTPSGYVTFEDDFNEDAISYSSPIVITKGGTYTGNWQSKNSGTPAVWIKTNEPVVLENSVIRGAGILIQAVKGATNLTVRNSRGYGLPYTADYFNDGNGNTYRPARRFINSSSFKKIVVENNYLEQTAGIYVGERYVGTSSSDTIQIRYNKVKNLDGRVYGGSKLVQFVQFNLSPGYNSVPGIDISWNQVVNTPGNSFVEDNINIFNTRGTSSMPMTISNNYIEGAYPAPGHTKYSGGGILTDCPNTNADQASAHIIISDNQVVSTMNYSFGIAGGNNIKFLRNRAVTSDYLRDGRKAAEVFSSFSIYPNGYWSKDYYKTGSTFNNLFDSNVVGIMRYGKRQDQPGVIEGAVMKNLIFLPDGPVTLEMQNNEYNIFSDKVKAKGIFIGPK